MMRRFADFIAIFRLYRSGGHSIRYAARIAFDCAFRGMTP